jgi:hypothetical protein
MAFRLVPLQRSSARPGSFAKRFIFSPGTDERDQVVRVVNQAKNDQCRIYVATNGDDSYGFIAVSISAVGDEEHPILVVNYLFVSLQYRGRTFAELGGVKVADYLLAKALELAISISIIAPIRYLGLEPANEQLSSFYRRRGFNKFDRTEWLFAIVPKPIY